jgi:hypothetical protein
MSNVRLTTQQFIEKANLVHNSKYGYEFVVYRSNRIKIKINCPIHGLFEQQPVDHLSGKGCRKCGYNKIASRCINSDFIAQAGIIHTNKYDYSLVEYRNASEKVKIICPIHGLFEQRPHNHIGLKSGCPACNGHPEITTSVFIDRCKQIHGDKYNYSLTKYEKRKSKVKIICPVHGVFEQSPDGHQTGDGCPKCPAFISKPHQEVIDFIRSLITEQIIINDRSLIGPQEIDILVGKLAIEFNGVYYHSYSNLETNKQRMKHFLKHDLCRKIDLCLLQINELEWIDPTKQLIIKSIIKHKMGLSNIRIYARKCSIRPISDGVYREFINQNHIQGYRSSAYILGLYDRQTLVTVMSFNRYGEGYEIMRLASLLGCSVVGAASRLLKHFRNGHTGPIMTYADRRFSVGNVYRTIGFKLIGITKPNYIYIKGRKSYSRQAYQKHKLASKLLLFNAGKTEACNMFDNGFRRMWDAGHYKFLLD